VIGDDARLGAGILRYERAQPNEAAIRAYGDRRGAVNHIRCEEWSIPCLKDRSSAGNCRVGGVVGGKDISETRRSLIVDIDHSAESAVVVGEFGNIVLG
jgi:hypothetical protein